VPTCELELAFQPPNELKIPNLKFKLGVVSIEALRAAPPEAPSLQADPVAVVGVGHLRIVRHLLV